MSDSRRKRKRERARELSAHEATALNGPKAAPIPPRPWGLLGEGAELTRGDLALIRLAINCDWPARRCIRRAVPKAILDGFKQRDADPNNHAAVRWTLAAVRTVLAME